MMRKFLLIAVFFCCVLSLNAQEKPNPKKEVEKEVIIEEESSKSFKLEEEMETPQKGEPVIGTEVFVEQEVIENQPASKPKKKKKKATAKKEDNN